VGANDADGDEPAAEAGAVTDAAVSGPDAAPGVDADADAANLLPPSPLAQLRAWLGPPASLRITRFLVLRLLGLVYFFAFLGAARQLVPLVGEHGLEPATDFVARIDAAGRSFFALPSLFRDALFGASDGTLVFAATLGVVVSALVLVGFATAPALALLWALYLSIVHVGQTFYGYGWEMQLCETGFLAIFLVGLDARPFPARPPPASVVWLYRWLAFRIMLGAGLIKWRGDPCWHELTCLDWHFETQPVPNPLSPWFHALPHGAHAAGVVFNHVCELVLPFCLFGPRRLRHVAATLMIAFQLTLIVSGNLAFLNWLTIIPLLACFDDRFWSWLAPRRVRAWLERRPALPAPTRAHTVAAAVLVAVVAFLSIDPVANLFSKRQRMNASFEPFELVNTYGAFGSVGDRRFELVIEGTLAQAADDPAAEWRAYEFPCKPGDPTRRPCVLGPYHHRLDWQMWFAAMGPIEDEPWTMRLVWKLLHADAATLTRFARDPFGGRPPRWIRIRFYRYHLAPPGSGVWWTRELEGDWLPPVSADDEWLRQFLEAYGWKLD
jgi:hypothetical protein